MSEKGVAVAIKIWDESNENGVGTYAEIIYAFGDVEQIVWNNMQDRKRVLPSINSYTIVFDERARKLSFREMKKRANGLKESMSFGQKN